MSVLLKRTPLYSTHLALGAKMVPFAGWEMPVQYKGLIEEHRATREAVGIFDVSHMGELVVQGPDAERFLQLVTCNDISRLVDGKAQYNAILNESGGVVDDIIVYRLAEDQFFICVNASNSVLAFAALASQVAHFRVRVDDVSTAYAQIAVQGPKAFDLLNQLPNFQGLDELKRFQFFSRGRRIIARTGYTGEDGVEIFLPCSEAASLWQELLSKGAGLGAQPVGLGARDTLRLEACYPLHGHELSPSVSAIESGLGWIVKFDKENFIGKAALQSQKRGRWLVGFEVEDPGIVRHGDILVCDTVQVGTCTSGTKTPTLNKALGLALVQERVSAVGSVFFALVRDKRIRCRVVSTPFYKRV